MILPFATVATALPNVISGSKCVQQLATFDDLTGIPAVSEINPVGTYKGLQYNSFDVLVQGVAGVFVTGIIPQSGDQVAANSITGDVLSGAPAFIPASPYKTLNLQSLYMACVANSVESVTGVPEQCTIAFTAYLPGSNVAYQTINEQFDPTNAVLSKMTKVTFPAEWIQMAKIEIAIVQSTTTSALTALLLDNVAYSVCS